MLFGGGGNTLKFNSLQTRSAELNDGTNTATNPLGVKVEKTETYETFTENSDQDNTGVYYYRNKLPESHFNANVSGVSSNFTFVSGEADESGYYSFLVYPVYWQTSNTITIGIQYTYNGTDYKIPIYTHKSGDELQAYTTDWSDSGSYEWKSIQDAPKSNTNESIGMYATQYRSRGIKVSVPANTEFLFYCTCHNGSYTFYSLTEKNETATVEDETVHIPHIATFLNSDELRCLGFEDWYGKYDSEEPDLNDLIVYTTLATPNGGGGEKGEDPISYILAAEDLGNIDDYDFNDIVLSVSHVAGKNTAEVTALAAGGTLPVVVYNGETALNDGKEFHQWFGDGSYSSSTMINTQSAGPKGETITIEVPEDFTMTSNQKGSDNKDATKMGGFKFKVTRTAYTGQTEAEWNLYAPENGTAPQMICVPGDWQWPTERTRIDDAYTGFGEWGENYGKTDWISSVVAGKVIGNSN